MFCVGLDIGQTQDFTALCVAERIQARPPWRGEPAWAAWEPPLPPPPAHYHVRHLERLPLGISYPDMVDHVRALLNRPPLGDSETNLAVDATGVGKPVVDLLRNSQLRASLYAVTITGGDTVSKDNSRYWRVPKRDLIAATQVLLQAQRLKIAAALPEAPVLVSELLGYRVKIDPRTAHDSYNAREGAHDDLVLALALAVFLGEAIVFTGEGIRFMDIAWGHGPLGFR